MHVTEKVAIRSFAKINLFLDVICRRRNGYHNIETIFQSVSLSDLLEIELIASGIDMRCDDPAVPTDESNLAARAFRVLAKSVDYEQGARISITKHIPAAAGLGGGSSNAAATLIAANRLLDAKLPQKRLHELAADLGADVPFFLTGGLAAAWRKGDRMTQLESRLDSLIVIAVPRDLRVSTAKAYGMIVAPDCEGPAPTGLSECTEGLRDRVEALSSHKRKDGIRSLLYNALEKPVFSAHPEIAEMKKRILDAGATGALMSGSGSAVFGLVSFPKEAQELAISLEEAFPCDCFVARTVNRGWRWEKKP